MSNTGFPNMIHELAKINRMAASGPFQLIAHSERCFAEQVREAVRCILRGEHNTRVLMLAGPSASGKTTTAHMLAEAFGEKGVRARIVSLDNFFYGRGIAPVMPDGEYDYESLEALNVPLMQQCLYELMEEGASDLPVFDFVAGLPQQERRRVELASDDIVIFEGIHALNPVITEPLSQDKLLHLFVSVETGCVDGEETVVSARQIRQLRRILRDYQFRACPPQQALRMWKQVCRGEELYINPFRDTADICLNSFHSYEMCVYRGTTLPLLEELTAEERSISGADVLIERLRAFVPIPCGDVPERSLLREFVGGGGRQY